MHVRWQETEEPAFVRPHPQPAVLERRLMRDVAAMVADKYGLPIAALRGPQRRRDVAWPRQEAFYLIYKQGWHSMPQIAAYFGDRDHTTVLHGIRAHEKRLEEARRA